MIFFFFNSNGGVQSSGMKQKELKVEDALVYLDQVSNIDYVVICYYITNLLLG